MKNYLTIIFLTILVTLTVIYGFIDGGSPQAAKNNRFDQQRVQDVQTIKYSVQSYFESKSTLPSSLSQIGLNSDGILPKDPETKADYAYHKLSETKYELCTAFATEVKSTTSSFVGSTRLDHPKGDYCFAFDITTR